MSPQENNGQCALCRQERQLVNSHWIPSFAVKAFKQESITGFLRTPTDQPNIRRQDAPTERLLCKECEDRFSAAESAFAKNVFHPYRKREIQKFECNERDRYFAASLAWRNITSKLRLNEAELKADGYCEEDLSALRAAECELRAYLLGDATFPAQFEQHLFFATDVITEDPEGINAYLLATQEMYVPGNDQYLYAVTNLSFGIVFICPLRMDEKQRAAWRGGTLLSPGSVIAIEGQDIADGCFQAIISQRPQQLEKYKTLSDKQQQKIAEAIKKADIGKWLKGWQGKAYVADFESKDSRRFLLVTWSDSGIHQVELPIKPLRDALVDSMPDVLARIESAEVGQGTKVVLDDGDDAFAVVRIA